MLKELLITAVAVALGVLIANFVAKKIPAFSKWEEWETEVE